MLYKCVLGRRVALRNHPAKPINREAERLLELVRATDFDKTGHSSGAGLILAHRTLLFHRFVAQKVALARLATEHLSGTGYLELLGNGFTCLDHEKADQQSRLTGHVKEKIRISARRGPPRLRPCNTRRCDRPERAEQPYSIRFSCNNPARRGPSRLRWLQQSGALTVRGRGQGSLHR